MKIRGTTVATPISRKAVTNDTSVSKAPWSSKNTIDKLAPAFEESGAIVTCEPVEGYPLSVVSQIAPTDKGCTSVTLWRCGKNLCTYPYTHDDVREAKVWTDNGVTRTINDDGSITLKGTATATMYKPRLSELKTGLEGTRCSPYTYYDPNNGIFHTLIGKGQTVDTTIYPQIEYGTVSTDYEPYRGDKFTVNFGRTVYGGSFDWKTGVLTTDEGEKIQYEAQEILALSGINTLYCDTGDITVSGRSDTTAVIDELTNAIIGLGGNPSGGSVGTTDHSKLTNRYAADAHPIDSITGLREALNGIPTDEHISGLIDGAMEGLPSLTNYYTKPETDKAIEDALADLPTGGGGGSAEWRLLADIALTEETLGVEISTDMDGVPLNCHEVCAFITNVGTDSNDQATGNGQLCINGKEVCVTNDTATKAGGKTMSFCGFNISTGLFYCSNPITYNTTTGIAVRPYLLPAVGNVINSVALYAYAPWKRKYGIGSTFKIFVR